MIPVLVEMVYNSVLVELLLGMVVVAVDLLGWEEIIRSKDLLIEQEVDLVVVEWVVSVLIIVVHSVEVNQDNHSLAAVVVEPKGDLAVPQDQVILAVMVVLVSLLSLIQPKNLIFT